jgi:hypothetical protein
MVSRAKPGPTAAIALVVVLFAARYHAFLTGGVLYFRDAGFFFVPWRSLFTRLAAEGFPFWNDWISSGRAYAADPNAAVFWPLTPLLFVLSPTGLAFANVLLGLLLFFAALRFLRLNAWACAGGCAVLLFAGACQSLPVYMTTSAALVPLPLAAAALAGFDPETATSRRGIALGASALGLSLFGGEPAMTAMGCVVGGTIVIAGLAQDVGAGRRVCALRRFRAAILAFLLAGGIAAVQLLPAAGELMRSARGQEMKAEHGSLFWSVRPTRVLTLLEPRLTGDPLAEDPADDWGSGTFDAGNPYFYDLALGLVPLVLAAVSATDRRGRAALGLAFLAVVLSFGRFFPASAFVGKRLTIFRYPEKWWMPATFALAAAAAIGIERLTAANGEERKAAWKRLKKAALVFAVPLLLAGVLAVVGPELLRKAIWGLGLGAGATPSARVAQALFLPFMTGSLSLVVVALVSFLVVRGRVTPAVGCAVMATVFLADGARRVAGSCPAGAPDLYRRPTPAVALVRAEMEHGRFYDDGADIPAVAARRTREAGGLDPLRPVTGVVFGIRYAGENDIDRMTPAASSRWVADTAQLPWGEEKVRQLRTAGVTVMRTHVLPPDPAGIVEIGRSGSDRILRVEAAWPAFALLPKAADEKGSLEVLFESPNEVRLRAAVPPSGAVLAITRTFDPNWKAALDGRVPLDVYRARGFLSAALVPAGAHTIVMRYRNSLFAWGAALTAASLLAVAGLSFFGRAR